MINIDPQLLAEARDQALMMKDCPELMKGLVQSNVNTLITMLELVKDVDNGTFAVECIRRVMDGDKFPDVDLKRIL